VASRALAEGAANKIRKRLPFLDRRFAHFHKHGFGNIEPGEFTKLNCGGHFLPPFHDYDSVSHLPFGIGPDRYA
jgi:hypothetical protein